MDNHTQAADNGITGGVKIVSYIQNNRGNHELVAGSMWHPVDIVNRQAWAEIDRQIKAAKAKVAAGRASCLHYYMTANQMNTSLLASYTGLSCWSVRLHMIPFFFKRLRSGTLKKYGETFKVTLDDLREGRLRPPVYKQIADEARPFA